MTTTASSPSEPQLERQRQRRGFWLHTLHQWHWISSAVCLVGMLLFALTGITLNHAASIPAQPKVRLVESEVPAALLAEIAVPEEVEAPLPAPLRRWLATELDLHLDAHALGEWMDDELYLALPRPGGDAWLSIDLGSGELLYELTTRG